MGGITSQWPTSLLAPLNGGKVFVVARSMIIPNIRDIICGSACNQIHDTMCMYVIICGALFKEFIK